ncbi:Uncharacterised protein [Vibrio cholerae]|nr:Uncharacterised protein [Vibrio cholerae]
MGLLKFFHDLVGKGAVIRRTNMQFELAIATARTTGK